MKKECEKIRESILKFLSEPIPEEIRVHLESCEECRREWMEWMELKRIFLKAFSVRETSLNPESILLRAKLEESRRKKIRRIWKVAGGFVAVAALFMFLFLKKDSEELSFEDEITISQDIEFYENLEVFENLHVLEDWGQENEGG